MDAGSADEKEDNSHLKALASSSPTRISNAKRVKQKIEGVMSKMLIEAVDIPEEGAHKELMKRLRKLAYQVNTSLADQQLGRAERFMQMQVRNDSATGFGTVMLGDVMAFAFRMIRANQSEFLDVCYGKIEKISKAVPAKGGRTKLQTQTSIHWDDEDATFLCRWFELAAPATVSLNATLTTQPSVSIKEKCKASLSARAEAAGRSAGSNQSDAEKAYTLPITSPIGYNWEVKAKDGMVLTPVTMVWSPERRVYLLNKRDEELAHELALALNAKDSNGRQHRFIGDQAPDKQPYSPAYESESDHEIKAKERKSNLEKGRKGRSREVQASAERMRKQKEADAAETGKVSRAARLEGRGRI
ncbi:hypothetical protein CEUSTIGMA_g13601.t1 [Chlamydomonas eustigma]|uniref:Uncharacterized protein n=1 Tax=Chlamydomonas eustigma TaxID=1157962 RepID=A0A250XT04_9CHLO|nr:hypothetical protein CEUSTIGMA_g13601.t1 [Chlamydomonas eustigma]|eukprot:GAX86188.1 hypothetical protein CEUSTIGMA_g13601.t1 [Chlamydomonas eustigma]